MIKRVATMFYTATEERHEMFIVGCIKCEFALLPRIQDICSNVKIDELALLLECLSLFLLVRETEKAFNRILANMMRRMRVLLPNINRRHRFLV